MKLYHPAFSKLFAPISRLVHAYPKISLVILAVCGIGFGTLGAAFWGGSGSSEGVMYTTDTVQKGTIETLVSGTGQVVAGNEVELKSDANADIVYVGAAVGDEVKKGTLLIQMDYTEAQKSVRDAEMGLEETQISYEKLMAPLTELELLSAGHALERARESLEDAEENLFDVYEDAFDNVSDIFIDMPKIMVAFDDVLYGNDISAVQVNVGAYTARVARYDSSINILREEVRGVYKEARSSYNDMFNQYVNMDRTVSQEDMESFLEDVHDMFILVSDSLRVSNAFLDSVDTIIAQRELEQIETLEEHQTSLASHATKISGYIRTLSDVIDTIESAREVLKEADRDFKEQELNYEDAVSGPDELDLRSMELSLEKKRNSLADAEENLSDYFVYAPIDGVIAAMNVVAGDSVYSVSSESNLGTIITSEQMAEITLNEVDAADVSTGQKAILTFDALPGIEVEGEVVEVDTIGTATQGVVTYGVKIAFDAEGTGVKTGMSVNASIKTAFEEDVLSVSSSAITIENGVSYVNVVSGMPGDTLYEKKEVVTGMSDDVRTEIISGLSEGDVVRIGAASSQLSTSEQGSMQGDFPAGGTGPGMGAGMMMGGMGR